MEIRVFTWLGREFVEISAAAPASADSEISTTELFGRFNVALNGHGLSLDNTVRIRVYGRDRQARLEATRGRSKILSGNRRSASSSFISQQWFDSPGAAGLELLALRPGLAGPHREPVDFEPARNYLCYLKYDGLRFFSGFTSEATTLAQQVSDVLATLNEAVMRAETDWSKVKKLSLLLQRGSDLGQVRAELARANRLSVPEIEFSFVDGFAGEKYLVEIEATALS